MNWSDVMTDHGYLRNLSDDGHTQYALLAGRVTGQTQIGGTGSGDKLTLESTTNATKGGVSLGASDWLDLPEVSAPGTPSGSTGAIYPKSDGKIYYKDDSGTEYDLTASIAS